MKTKISQSEARLKVVTGKNSLTNLANEVYNSLSNEDQIDNYEALFHALKHYFNPQKYEFRSLNSATISAMNKHLDHFRISTSLPLEIFCIDFFTFKKFPKMTVADLYYEEEF